MAKRAVVHSITIELPRTLPRVFRSQVSEAIEAHLQAVTLLTAVLDKADGDADLEPSLAWRCDKPANVDLEEDSCDDELSGDEGEPSLSHTNDFNQERAQRHLSSCEAAWNTWSDLEQGHDGRESSLRSRERA